MITYSDWHSHGTGKQLSCMKLRFSHRYAVVTILLDLEHYSVCDWICFVRAHFNDAKRTNV
jgi:hypothetical protein